jgi:hypothetical protein
MTVLASPDINQDEISEYGFTILFKLRTDWTYLQLDFARTFVLKFFFEILVLYILG